MNPLDEWGEATRRAFERVQDAHFEEQGSACIEEAERLLAVACRLKGVACLECSGLGRRMYSSTATWRGGIGGQAMTDGVCDSCWGTGRTDKTGPDLRQMTPTATRTKINGGE